MTAPEVLRRVELRPLSSYAAKATEWLWPGRIPAGELTVLAGDGGLGKSTLAAWIAAKVTTGEFRGLTGMRSAWTLLGEDDPARVLKLRYRAAGCDMGRVGILAAAADADARRDDCLSLPADFPELAAKVRQSTPELLIVDPLTAFLGGSIDAHRDGGQGGLRAVLGPLQRIAHEHGTTVLVLAHLNKGSGPSSQRIGGSAGVRNAARNVLLLAPHPEARDSGEDDGRRVLGHEKCNYGSTAATLDLTVTAAPAMGDDEQPITLVDGSAATTSLAVLGEESEVDYRDALAAASTAASSDAPAGGRAEAEAFLREALANGPVEVRTLNAEAQTLGISDRTLKRARSSLGVVARKEASGWVVHLPAEGGPLGPLAESLENSGDRPLTFDEFTAKGANGAYVGNVAPLAPLNGATS